MHLTIVDAICGDLTFEEGGHPVPMDRLIGGIDPVLVNSYGASLLRFDVRDIKYLPLAEKVGVGNTNLNSAVIHEHRLESKNNNIFVPGNIAERLAKNVTANAA